MDARNRRTRRVARPRIITLWVLVGALMIACILFVGVLSVMTLLRPSTGPLTPATAVLHVQIAPTATQPTLTLPPSTVTISPPPVPEPGVITTGAFVQIQGTGGEGLRLRDQPGLDGEVLLLGSEAEVFTVADGPQDTDGYTWWLLVGPFDETRQGWAVSNYLVVVQNP